MTITTIMTGETVTNAAIVVTAMMRTETKTGVATMMASTMMMLVGTVGGIETGNGRA